MTTNMKHNRLQQGEKDTVKVIQFTLTGNALFRDKIPEFKDSLEGGTLEGVLSFYAPVPVHRRQQIFF